MTLSTNISRIDETMYRINCGCMDDHSIILSVETEDGLYSSLVIYADISIHLPYTGYAWFQGIWDRIKTASKVLFTGEFKLNEEIIIQSPEHLNGIIEAFEEIRGMQETAKPEIFIGEKKRMSLIRDMNRLLETVGGICSPFEASKISSLSEEELEAKVKNNELISISDGFPVWQFTDGPVVGYLDRVLPLLKNVHTVDKLTFFLTMNTELGATPADFLITMPSNREAIPFEELSPRQQKEETEDLEKITKIVRDYVLLVEASGGK